MTGMTTARGRHRLGAAGLRHCRDFDGVRERLATAGGRHVARRPTAPTADRPAARQRLACAPTAPQQLARRPAEPHRQPDATTGAAKPGSIGRRLARIGGTVVAAVLVVSGWYTVTGASAVAQMISP
jgi:hypothetical protein